MDTIQPSTEPTHLPAKAPPLVPERTNFLDGDAPSAAKVEAFLAKTLAGSGGSPPSTTGALVPWICDVLLFNHSVKAYGRDLANFVLRRPSGNRRRRTLSQGHREAVGWN